MRECSSASRHPQEEEGRSKRNFLRPSWRLGKGRASPLWALPCAGEEDSLRRREKKSQATTDASRQHRCIHLITGIEGAQLRGYRRKLSPTSSSSLRGQASGWPHRKVLSKKETTLHPTPPRSMDRLTVQWECPCHRRISRRLTNEKHQADLSTQRPHCRRGKERARHPCPRERNLSFSFCINPPDSGSLAGEL